MPCILQEDRFSLNLPSACKGPTFSTMLNKVIPQTVVESGVRCSQPNVVRNQVNVHTLTKRRIPSTQVSLDCLEEGKGHRFICPSAPSHPLWVTSCFLHFRTFSLSHFPTFSLSLSHSSTSSLSHFHTPTPTLPLALFLLISPHILKLASYTHPPSLPQPSTNNYSLLSYSTLSHHPGTRSHFWFTSDQPFPS